MILQGNGTLSGQVSVHGNYVQRGGSFNFNFSQPPFNPSTGAAITPDPYATQTANISQTFPGTCSGANPSPDITASRSGGGTFCKWTNGDLSNGVYYINDSVNITGSVTLTNATVISYGDITFGGQATVSFGSGYSGNESTKGLVLINPTPSQDRIRIDGSVTITDLNGGLYFPHDAFVTIGNQDLKCGFVVAYTIDVGGNVLLNTGDNCDISNIYSNGPVSLVR